MKFRFFGTLMLCAATLGVWGCEGQGGDDSRAALRPPGVCLGGLVSSESSGIASAPKEISLPVGDHDSTIARVWEPQARTEASTIGIIFVTGVDGGFLEPADNIYDWAAERFSRLGVHSVFVEYRYAGGYLAESLEDTEAAAKYLRGQGVDRMAIVGWSFGGAVITNAARAIPEITTVVGFAPQSDLTVPILPTQSIQLFHSEDDENVPFYASSDILSETPPESRREMNAYQGYNHALDNASPEIQPRFARWLEQELSTRADCGS